MTSAPLITAIISVATSLCTTIAAFLIQESIRTNRQISRMVLGLSIDCMGSIHAFENDLESLGSCISRVSNPPSDASQDLEILRCLPCGFIVSPPLEFAKELVNLLPRKDAEIVLHYYDSWGRYHILEERYRDLFQSMLGQIAVASSDQSKRREYEIVRDELFEQLTALVKDLYRTLNKLASLCCKVLLMVPKHSEFTEPPITANDLTGTRWNSWQEVRQACEDFELASKRDV